MANLKDSTYPPPITYDREEFNNILQYYNNYYGLISKVVSILDSFVPKEIAGNGGCNLSVSHDMKGRIVNIFYGEIIEEETELSMESSEAKCAPESWMTDDEQCDEVSQDVADEVIEEILDSRSEFCLPSLYEEVEPMQHENVNHNFVMGLTETVVQEEQRIEDEKHNPTLLCSDELILHDTPPVMEGASSETTDPKYICQYVDCPATFFLAKEYSVHQEKTHPWLVDTAIAVRCKYITCTARFDNIQLLHEHHATHRLKNGGRKKCSTSETTVGGSLEECSQPRTVDTDRPARYRKCEYCETLLDPMVNVYSKHCLEVHNRSPYSCPLCADPFHLQSHLMEHIKTEHSDADVEDFIAQNLWRAFTVHEGVRMFECRFCFRVFYSQKSRDTHIDQHRKEVRRSCAQCGGKHYETFCSHPKPKYDARFEKLHCAQCDRWMSKKSFKEHLVTHTSQRDFPCTVCKKTFKVRRTATRHIQSHVNANNLKRKCYDCATVFTDERQITDHYRVEHPLLRPYWCPICNEGFYEKETLTDHCHAHTDDERRMVSVKVPVAFYHIGSARVFECTLCRRSFSTKRATIAHWIVHTDRPFVCSHCSMSFRVEAMLGMHLVDVHQVKDVTI